MTRYNFTLPFFIFLLFVSYSVNAQEKSTIDYSESRAQLTARFKEMVESVKLDELRMAGKPCALDPKIFNAQIKPKISPYIEFSGHLSYVESMLTKYLPKNFQYSKGEFNTIADKALSAHSNTDNFGDFVSTLTGQDLGALGKEKIVEKSGRQWSETDIMKDIYDVLFVYKRKSNEAAPLSFKQQTAGTDCKLNYSLYLKDEGFKYPKMKYKIILLGTYDCPCTIEGESQVTYARVEYSAYTEGVVAHGNSSFETLENPTLKILSLACCPPMEETTFIDPALDTAGLFPAAYSPTSMIGGSFGFDYESGSKSTGLCLGGDYLHQIGSTNNAVFMAGAQVQFETASFGSGDAKYSQTLISAGPKVEAHFPMSYSSIVPYSGLGVTYGIGSSKSQSLKMIRPSFRQTSTLAHPPYLKTI